MKGCLAVIGVLALLAGLLLVGGVGFAFYKGKQLHERTVAAAEDLRKTDQEFPFTPPADGLLDEARVATWAAVRRDVAGMIDKTLEHAEEVDRRFESEEPGFVEGMKTMFGVAGSIIELLERVPRELAAGLRRERMSLAEYGWITERMHGTVSAAAKAGDAAAKELQDRIRDRADRVDLEINDVRSDYAAVQEHFESQLGEYPAENLAIVLRHADDLTASRGALGFDFFQIVQGFEDGSKSE